MTKIINSLFMLFSLSLMIAVFLIDKNVPTLFPNTVKWDNAGYFLIALMILYMCSFLISKYKLRLSDKDYKIVAISIASITAVLQFIVSRWMPVEITADFSVVRQTAINIAGGGYTGK